MTLVVNSHCMEPGTGTGPRMIDFYIMLCTVYTTLRPGTGTGMGPEGTNGFHTHFTGHVPVPGEETIRPPLHQASSLATAMLH